jgi:hypothetical protein
MFSIFRDQSAMTSLKEAWEQAEPEAQNAILRATRQLDQELQQDPTTKGESRDGATRVLFEAPLAVLFVVDEERKLVRVLRAWHYRTADRRDRKE